MLHKCHHLHQELCTKSRNITERCM